MEGAGTPHSVSKKIKPAENKFIQLVSRVFPCKFLQFPIASLTCRGVHCIFKIYQIISGTSKMRQFHEFLRPIFWRVFSNWPSCCAPAREDFFCCSTIKGKTILALHLSHLGFLFEDVSWLLVSVEQNTTKQHFLP